MRRYPSNGWDWNGFAQGLILVAAFFTFGLIVVYADRDADADGLPVPPAITEIVVTEIVTIEVVSEVYLPRDTPEPSPTMMQATIVPTAIKWCATPTPDTVCRMKPLPSATAIPMPTCPARPGEECVWRTNGASD